MRLTNPTLRVLLVDDEPAILRALRRGLTARRPQWQLSLQTAPLDALNSLVGAQVDVIVSDFEMPGMSGVELFRRIKRQSPATLRIILSGQDKTSAGPIGPGVVHAWLPKTHTAVELVAAIEELLVRRDRQRRGRRAS